MGTTEEEIEEAGGEAAKALKKVIASRGKIQGNFYYAGDSAGAVAGLIVTLTARDPKGAKAASAGKALRKAIPGAKFGRGVVIVEGSKLLFDLRGGSISDGQMKVGFKKAFEGDKLKELKAFLKKAVIRAAEGAEDGADEAPSTPAPTAPTSGDEALDFDAILNDPSMSPEERQAFLSELREIEALQGDLTQRNQELSSSFLSTKALEEERQEQISDLQAEIAQLQAATPPDQDAILKKAFVLAELAPSGAPMPSTGGKVSPETKILLTATETVRSSLPEPEPKPWATAVSVYSDALITAQKQLGGLTRVLSQSQDPELKEIADKKLLNSLIDRFVTELRSNLDAVNVAVSPDGAVAAKKKVAASATRFADHLSSSPGVSAVDNNPHGVEVSLQAKLATALRGLARSAQL